MTQANEHHGMKVKCNTAKDQDDISRLIEYVLQMNVKFIIIFPCQGL